jgi:hypothetical protein
MLISVEIKGYSSFNLALVQWYDFRYKNDIQRSYKYSCPLLQITDMYNVIPIESIIELVQVSVPNFRIGSGSDQPKIRTRPDPIRI